MASPDDLRVALTVAYNGVYTGAQARATDDDLAKALQCLYDTISGSSFDRDAVEVAAGEVLGHISCISLDPGARFALESAVDDIVQHVAEIPQRIGDMGVAADYSPSR